jgi:energy-coupling factor transporter transmembrane protein EcfT
MDTLKNIEAIVENNVKTALNNPYVMAIVKISLVLYAAQIAPKVPQSITGLFQNTLFKIVVIALIAYLADVDFQLAIIIAIVYVLGMNGLSGRGFFESYNNVMPIETPAMYYSDTSKLTDLLGKPVSTFGTIIESNSDNYSGCDNVTMKDILALFDGDHAKLQSTVMFSYKALMEQLPNELPAKEKLVKIAHALGIPYNVELNDKNAPLIATFLLNVGYVINDTCQPPN